MTADARLLAWRAEFETDLAQAQVCLEALLMDRANAEAEERAALATFRTMQALLGNAPPLLGRRLEQLRRSLDEARGAVARFRGQETAARDTIAQLQAAIAHLAARGDPAAEPEEV